MYWMGTRERMLQLMREHKVGLFGAITSKPPADAERELPVHLQGGGRRYLSPVLALRKVLDLDVSPPGERSPE